MVIDDQVNHGDPAGQRSVGEVDLLDLVREGMKILQAADRCSPE